LKDCAVALMLMIPWLGNITFDSHNYDNVAASFP
jgi:hypothetical protein